VLVLNANVYPAPVGSIKAPAVVLRPDDPWIRPGPAMGTLTEGWLAIAVAPAADPRSGMNTLYSLLLGVVDALPAGWALRDTGRPIVDESTGVPMLAAACRLTYAVG
jgi:hypothetical protein